MEKVFETKNFRRVKMRGNKRITSTFAARDAEVEGAVVRVVAMGNLAPILATIMPGAEVELEGIIEQGTLGITNLK